MGERSWRLAVQTRRLQSTASGAGGLWNDEAGKAARQRYLSPHASSASALAEGLERHEELVDEANDLARQSSDQLLLAEAYAAQVQDELQRLHQDVSTAHDQAHRSATSADRAQGFLAQAGQAMQQANAECAGCVGPHGSAAASVVSNQALVGDSDQAGSNLQARAAGLPSDLADMLLSVNPRQDGEVDSRNADQPNRFHNCARCAIAVDRSLGGTPSVAEPSVATDMSWIESQVGGQFADSSSRGLQTDLLNAGPGSRGIVAVHDGRNEGHVFNAVNVNGRVFMLDGQTGGLASIPPMHFVSFLRTA